MMPEYKRREMIAAGASILGAGCGGSSERDVVTITEKPEEGTLILGPKNESSNLAGVDFWLSKKSSNSSQKSLRTDNGGKARIEGLETGLYELEYSCGEEDAVEEFYIGRGMNKYNVSFEDCGKLMVEEKE